MTNSLNSFYHQSTEQSQQKEIQFPKDNYQDPHTKGAQSEPAGPDSPVKLPSNSKPNLDSNTFSLCLLLKDDNDILNEWIAYHYHTLNLRYMIVALDPFSQTSPEPIFEKWRNLFGMTIEVWTDKDYMPDFFLQGKYDQVDSFIPQFVNQDQSKSIWHTDTSNASQVEQDLIHINNHRFRQVTFVSHCFEVIKKNLPNHSVTDKKGKQQPDFQHWVGHIDTDEYIVINPLLRDNPNRTKLIDIPNTPTSGSILQFLMDLFAKYPKRLSRSCFMIPTVLFGAQIHDDWTHSGGVINFTTTIDTDHWNAARFETLRWRIHADYSNIINGLQKAILDLSHLPADHEIFQKHRIKSVHMPLDKGGTHGCRQMSLKPEIHAVRLFPLSINHYVGSRERYLSRPDKRRNIEIYEGKARVTGGVDDGWIRGWLPSFVQEHGLEKASQVLEEYRVS